MGEITLIGETSPKFLLGPYRFTVAELLISISPFLKLQYVFKILKDYSRATEKK
jgi:hypothetical protein